MAFLTPDDDKELLTKYGDNSHSQVLASVAGLPQQEAAGILKKSLLSGAAPADVAANPKAYDNIITDPGNWDDFAKRAPKTASFLYDPLNMAITRTPESFKALSNIEKITGTFREGFKDVARGFANWQLSKAELKKTLEDQYLATLPDADRLGIRANYGDPAGQRAQRYGAMANSPRLAPQEVKADTTLGQYGLDFVRMVPQIGAQIGVAAVAGPQTSAAFMFSQIAGGQYGQLRKEGVDPERAFFASVANATMQTPLEYVGLSKIMSKLPVGKPFTRDLIERAATEGLTEFLQQYPDALTTIAAKDKAGGVEGWVKQFADNFWEITKEGLYQGAVAAPFGIIGGMGAKLHERRTQAFVQHREQVQAEIARAPVTKVSPELMQQHSDAVSDGAVVYVDPAGVALFQDKNPAVLDQLGVTAEDVQTAAKEGAMLEIPAGRFDVAAAQNPEIQTALKDDIAPDADGLTMRRIKERNTRDVQKALAEQQAQIDELRTEQDKLVKAMEKAGVQAEAARSLAVGLVANARVMSPDNPAQFLRDNAPQFRKAKETPKGLVGAFKSFFQPAIPWLQKDVKLPPTVPVISIPADAVNIDRPIGVVQKESFANARDKFQGKTFTNEHTGWSIEVGKTGLGKVFSHAAAPIQSLTMTALDKMLENGVYLRTEADRNNKLDVKAWHYFYAPAEIGDKFYAVKVAVRETTQGQKFYDHAVVETERPAGNLLGRDSLHTVAQHQAYGGSYALSIDQLVGIVNEVRKTEAMFQGERGMIHWQNGRAIITMFEGKSDASTVIHEAIGHYMVVNLLEQGAKDDAPATLKADRKAALDFAGIEDWDKATDEQKRQALEKLAEAAEVYIMEGKAPSLETRGMFQRFAEWLTEIYRAVKLSVKLTPEIRGVFDRLLATQEEIDQMEAVEGYLQRIPQDVYDSLTDAQKRDLDRLLDSTREQAESQVRARLMNFVKADNRTKLKEERAAATERITAEVKAEPLYVAEAMIEQAFNRKAKAVARAYIGNTPMPYTGMGTVETLEAIRQSMIERGDLEGAAKMQAQIEELGEEGGKKIKELPPDQQAELEFLAEVNGFPSGAELAHNLLAYNTSKSTIENRVDDHMKQFRDLLDDPVQLEQDVRESMYSDDGALLLAAEQQIIEEKLGRVITREEGRKAQARRRAVAQAAAQDAMGRMPLERAMKLRTWIANERRAAEKKAKALAKGDLETAYEQGEIQLYNHAMVQESLRIRREFERIEKYLRRQQKSDKTAWKKEEHFNQAAEIMLRFGYIRTDYERMARRESLQEWAARMDAEMDAVEIAGWLFNEGFESGPRDLTIGQLRDIENAIRNIKRLAQTESAFLKLFDKADIQDAIIAMNEMLAHKEDVYQPMPEGDAGMTKTQKISQAGRRYLFSIKKFTGLVNAMDGGKDFGFFYRLLYEGVYKAANEVSGIVNALEQRQQADLDRIYTPEERKALTKAVYYPELGAAVSKLYLLEMASHTGSASNRQRLFGTKPIGLEASKMWSKNPDATGENVMAFLGRALTAKDWQYVQAGWDNINTLWEPADGLQRRMTGFGMVKVEALPFAVTLADGNELSMRGGYYPLKQDPRSDILAEQREEESKPLYTERVRAFSPATQTGYTHARTGASYPIDLRPENKFRHMQGVAHDIAFREVITDLRRLVRNKEFKVIVERKFGQEAYSSIVDFVAAAATAKTEASTGGEKLLNQGANWLRSHTIAAALMFRAKTAIQNAANPFLYGTSVDGFGQYDVFKALLNRGMMGYWTSPDAFRAMREDVFAKSAFMRDRLRAPDFLLNEFLDKAQGKDNALTRWGAAILSETDNLTAIPVWTEAYQKHIDAGKSEYEAVRFADTVVDRAIGSGRKIDTAPLMRGTGVQRLLTMFQTFFNTQYNAWSREYNIFLEEKDVLRLTTFVATRWWLFVMVSAFLGGDAPDSDDDKWAQKWAKEILGYPLRLFPIVGDAMMPALDKVLGTRNYGYRMTPAETTIQIPAKILGGISDVAEGKRDLVDVLETAAAAAAILRPYPDQFNDWFFNAYDILVNDMEPKPADVLKRRPRSER